MYEVSIQGKCLLFISDLMQVDLAKPVNLVQIRSKDDLLQFLDSLAHTKGLTQDRFYLVCEDERQSWLDFVALYHWIEAAGGLVSNVQHPFLLILKNTTHINLVMQAPIFVPKGKLLIRRMFCIVQLSIKRCFM